MGNIDLIFLFNLINSTPYFFKFKSTLDYHPPLILLLLKEFTQWWGKYNYLNSSYKVSKHN